MDELIILDSIEKIQPALWTGDLAPDGGCH